jgi:outer membrane biogenesis lipoprotein LolB
MMARVLLLALTTLLLAGCATLSVQPFQGQAAEPAWEGRDVCLD